MTDNKFVKPTYVKNFFKSLKIRSSKKTNEKLITIMNSIIEEIITKSVDIAHLNSQKTVMVDDITEAIDAVIAKKNLTWKEILEQVLMESPADLGKISKEIYKYIEKNK